MAASAALAKSIFRLYSVMLVSMGYERSMWSSLRIYYLRNIFRNNFCRACERWLGEARVAGGGACGFSGGYTKLSGAGESVRVKRNVLL